jgi:hypothetical protein
MNKPCPFSDATLQFSGSPADQARCLLRQVKVGGNVDDAPTPVPQLILDLVGKPVDLTRDQLASYLARNGIAAADIGGPLSDGVSVAPNGTKALYFMIHDTSDELSTNSFPADINTATWPPNNLAKRDTSSAHIFINRLGQSHTGHQYSQAWRATKREHNSALKGLFLHHELVQPRIKGSFKFAAVGPEPGFTPPQIERLAVCYVAAAVRRGSWLIPASHCVLDLGIADGHDDPQNFDVSQWAAALDKVLSDAKQSAAPRVA